MDLHKTHVQHVGLHLVVHIRKDVLNAHEFNTIILHLGINLIFSGSNNKQYLDPLIIYQIRQRVVQTYYYYLSICYA